MRKKDYLHQQNSPLFSRFTEPNIWLDLILLRKTLKMNRPSTFSLVFLAVFVEFGLADELDVITKMAEDDRPDYIARKLEEYSDNYVSSVMQLKLSEKGVRQFEIQDPGNGLTSEERKVDLVHELVLSIENRYTNIADLDGTRTVQTYDGKTGKRFRYAASG